MLVDQEGWVGGWQRCMQRLDDILVDKSDETLSVDLRWDATGAVPSQHHRGVHAEEIGELCSGEELHGTCWYMTVTTSHTVRLIPRRMARVIFMTVGPLGFPVLLKWRGGLRRFF